MAELGPLAPEVAGVTNRSNCMATIYPGGNARYIRHVDNPDGNGRLLTCILYLNSGWRPKDGGALRMYRCMARPQRARGGWPRPAAADV